MAWAPLAIAAVQAVGQMQQAQAQGQAVEQQAQNIETNAYLTKKEGLAQETNIRSQKDRVLGAQVAAAAGSGVDVTKGSVMDALKQSAFDIEMDAITARENALTQSAMMKREAELTRMQKPSGLETLLGVGGTAMQGYGQYKLGGS